MNTDEYIKAEITDIKKDVREIQGTLVGIQVDIARIQTETRLKTAFYGTIGGIIPAVGVAIYFLAR